MPLTVLILGIMFFLWGFPPNHVIRVTELICKEYAPGDGKCAKQKRGSSLTFTINTNSNAVAMTVQRNAGDWGVGSMIFHECSIVDSDNWECNAGVEKIGVMDGVYGRHAEGLGSYQIDGLVGWRYWKDQLNLKG